MSDNSSKKSTFRKKKYHAVYLPFPDVYDQGGPEAFNNLERKNSSERNLIVLPFDFIETLYRLETVELSMGARDAQIYIKDSKDKKLDFNFKEGSTLYRAREGLDLLILDDATFSKPNFSITELKRYIDEFVSFNEFKIITNDARHHIKYSGRGMDVEDPGFLQVNESIVHEGIILGNDKLQAKLFSSDSRSLDLGLVMELLDKELYMNQFVKFSGAKGTKYARVTGKLDWNVNKTRIIGVDKPELKLLNDREYDRLLKPCVNNSNALKILGVGPRDMEQYLALQYGLFNKDISLFFLCGKAGSGKTLLTYATAVDSVLLYDQNQREVRAQSGISNKFYRQITLLKPPEILGGSRRDPGALPGTLLDKLKPHLRPYIDAHRETIMKDFPFNEMFKHPKYENDYGSPRNKEISSKSINGGKLPDMEVIDLIYSGFIGGASIRDTFIVIDEAQDFTPYEMKTIIERIAEGSKIIICGDAMQTRNPKCTPKVNGLTFAIKHFLPKHYSGLVYLNKNYRDQASEDSDSMRAYNT